MGTAIQILEDFLKPIENKLQKTTKLSEMPTEELEQEFGYLYRSDDLKGRLLAVLLNSIYTEKKTIFLMSLLILISKKLEMPFSTMVYSGNKSYHWIISLETPLRRREDYDFLWRWIANIIGVADQATKNPSRLTRYPNFVRSDTGKVQRLYKVKQRISADTLQKWLLEYPDKVPSLIKETKVKDVQMPKKDRSSIVKLVDWYVQEYLGCSFVSTTIKVRCPLCADEGADNHCDNLAVTGENRYIHCFRSDEHNKGMLSKLHQLKRQCSEEARSH